MSVCTTITTKSLKAIMDGYQVMPMTAAAAQGDIFVTATGMAGVIRIEHMLAMKDGTILANSGHFDVEVDVAALQAHAVAKTPIRDPMVEYRPSTGNAL